MNEPIDKSYKEFDSSFLRQDAIALGLIMGFLIIINYLTLGIFGFLIFGTLQVILEKIFIHTDEFGFNRIIGSILIIVTTPIFFYFLKATLFNKESNYHISKKGKKIIIAAVILWILNIFLGGFIGMNYYPTN